MRRRDKKKFRTLSGGNIVNDDPSLLSIGSRLTDEANDEDGDDRDLGAVKEFSKNQTTLFPALITQTFAESLFLLCLMTCALDESFDVALSILRAVSTVNC